MNKWIKRIIIAAVIIGIVILIFNKPEENKVYRTSEAKYGDIETIISGSGTLVPSKERKEYSKVSAEVLDVYFEEGDIVREGDIIAKLDSSNYETNYKSQEIAIKQSTLSKQTIEKQIKDLEIKAESSGYVSGLSISEGSYVTSSMAICNLVQSNKYEVVLQFVYYEDRPIVIGTKANVTLVDSFSNLTGIVTKVGDMRKMSIGNSQVIDVTIEVETTGYSLEGANAKAEIAVGNSIVLSSNISGFKSINVDMVRAKSTGTVKSLLVYDGKFVSKGDTIAILENDDLYTNLNNINLSIENLNNQLDSLKKVLDDYEIKAPIDGTITSLSIENGDMISMGTHIVSISNKDVMEFVIPVDELDIPKLKKDNEVRVSIDALSYTLDNPISGRITNIPYEGNTVAGVTDYYVTIEIDGTDDMRISMNANADIVVQSVKNVLIVPIDSLIKESGKRYVDVLLDDGMTVERKEVTIGASDMSNIEIISGLEEGANVIVPEITSTGIMGF